MRAWLVDQEIDPHIPVWDQTKVAPEGKFTRADCTYDRKRDRYVCPAGKTLKTSSNVVVGSAIKYMAKRSDCAACPLKSQCTTGRERRLSRDVNQDARDYTQTLMQTDAYEVSRGERKKIERLLARPRPTCR